MKSCREVVGPVLVLTFSVATGCAEPHAASSSSSAQSSLRSASSSEAATRPPRELAIASFNVLYENARETENGDVVDPDTIDAVKKLADADLVLFQETNPPFERAIRAALGSTHPTCSFHAPTHYSPGGLGFCVRASLVIDDEAELASPVDWFPAQRALLAWGGTKIQVVNVHLRPAIGNRDKWWDANAATLADRNAELAAYLGKLDRSLPTFVVGDFNDPNHKGAVATLEREGFDSALGIVHVDTPTWAWAGDPPLAVQLDHVTFDARRFEVMGGEVRAIGRSDHFPIFARFRERSP